MNTTFYFNWILLDFLKLLMLECEWKIRSTSTLKCMDILTSFLFDPTIFQTVPLIPELLKKGLSPLSGCLK